MGWVLGIIIALVLMLAYLGIGGSGFIDALSRGLSQQYSELDNHRISSAVMMMQTTGTTSTLIKLNEEYESVSLSSSTLTLDPKATDEKLYADLPDFYSYTVDSSLQDYACIQKSGMEVSIQEKTPSTCGIETCDHGGSSVQMEDGVPKWGYYCERGTFKDYNFFEEFYEEYPPCPSPGGCNFTVLNRIACPDTVSTGRKYSCVIEASWNCTDLPDNQTTLSLQVGASSYSKSFNCTSEVTHERFYHPFDAKGYGGYISVTGRVDGPETTDFEREQIEVRDR